MKKLVGLSLLVCLSTKGFAQTTTNVHPLDICVIHNGDLQMVTVDYNTETGDTTVLNDGVRKKFQKVYPASVGYALNAAWYKKHLPITFMGKKYVKWGLTRIYGIYDIVKAGEYQKVNVYADSDPRMPADFIYIPVRPGCEFQPYRKEEEQAEEVKPEVKEKKKTANTKTKSKKKS